MKTKCLHCYKALTESETDFHKACIKQFFGTDGLPKLDYSLSEMEDLAKEIVAQNIAVPGVQAKLSMTTVTEPANNRLTITDALNGNYIFKPPTKQFKEMPENEHLTMRMAEAFGIKVVTSSLIRLASGELGYITKRIDRTAEGEKIHMLDMFQITEAFDKYKSSMEKIGKALNAYSSNTLLDKVFYFELALFSFLTGNNDMHLKNFSMIESASGWVLAPAYDLLNVAIVLPEDTEELALTIEGKKKKLKREHFERFGENLGLSSKQIQGVFRRFVKSKKVGVEWIEKSLLSEEMKISYKSLFFQRYEQVNLT